MILDLSSLFTEAISDFMFTDAGKEMHCLSSSETECGAWRRNLVRTRSNPPMLHGRESGNWRSMARTPRVCVTANGFVGRSGFVLVM